MEVNTNHSDKTTLFSNERQIKANHENSKC